MDGPRNLAPARGQPRLLDQVRDVIRRLHYSIRTEQADVDWIRRFILFHGKRRPAEIGAVEVEAFLTHLAAQGQVASSTQNQALNAIVFLYRQVLKRGIRLAGVWDRGQSKNCLGIFALTPNSRRLPCLIGMADRP